MTIAGDETTEHFIGCHRGDDKAPETERPLSEIPDTEECWHCHTLTPRGVCNCNDCWDNADYIPPSAVSHCPTCGRWWAYMIGINVIAVTVPGSGQPSEADR